MKKSFFFPTSHFLLEVIHCELGKVERVILHERTPQLAESAPFFPATNEVYRFLLAYFAGKPQKCNLHLLALEGLTSFQRDVLQICAAIPYGKLVSYGDLASALGKPQAARAVGQVMAFNPFPLLVPCHRVVRNNGYLGEYAYGRQVKRWLLEQEGVRVTRQYPYRIEEALSQYQHCFDLC